MVIYIAEGGENMTIEEKLKNYILSKYRSVREFTMEFDIPYSTVAMLFKRGMANSSIQTIIRICQALEISADELAEGKIVPIVANEPKSTSIENIVAYAQQRLLSCKNLTINNNPATEDAVNRIVNALDVILEIEKRNYKG